MVDQNNNIDFSQSNLYLNDSNIDIDFYVTYVPLDGGTLTAL